MGVNVGDVADSSRRNLGSCFSGAALDRTLMHD